MTTNYESFAPGARDLQQNDEPLWQFLTAHAEKPIRIDLSEVTDLPAARLQLLIAAQKQWSVDGVPMVVDGITETLLQGLTRMGVPEDFFEKGSL
jgi:anti-anti-sigma regulatory factor